MEFIIQSQARLAAGQEHDREQRIEFQQWSQGLHRQVVELTQLQSRRLDRYDKWLEETRQESQISRKRNEEFQKEALHLLHRILDRLTRNPNSKN